jgi:hypothetical protein
MMTKNPSRFLALGLGALSIPACYGWQQPFVSEPAQTVVSAPVTTVKRVAPEPTPTNGQYVQAPAPTYQRLIQYDQYGRAFERIGVDFNRPTTVIPQPQPQTQPVMTPTTAITEPVEVVAVTHTSEPPLAMFDQPIRPIAARQMSDKSAQPSASPPAVSYMPTTASAIPTTVPAGTQILIVHPQNGAIQSQMATIQNEVIPNLLTPPVPPEELKLVSIPKNVGTNSPLLNALRAYQDKSPAEADKHLAHLDPVNQQLLKRLLPLAVKLGENGMLASDPTEVAELVDQLQQVVMTLRTKAALRIDKLCYCRAPVKPMRTGIYQPLPDDYAFRPGETVELYMELRNFSCEAKEAEYRTHVTTVIEIRDDRGEVLSRYEFERDRPDIGQAPRQDYFHICRFPVQGLAAGQYTLTAHVTDVPSGKSAKKTLPLRIEAVRRVARGYGE